jgi:hypothetical protein
MEHYGDSGKRKSETNSQAKLEHQLKRQGWFSVSNGVPQAICIRTLYAWVENADSSGF